MTNRSTVMLFTLIALTIGSGTAGATHDQGPSDGPPHDFAVGGGQYVNPAFGSIELSAQNHGDRVTGYVVRDADLHFAGHVVCLRVDGNLATITYDVENGGPNAFPGRFGRVWIQDNGRPGMSATPDYVQHASPFLPNPRTCEDPRPVSPIFAVDGNFTVHDGAVSS